MLQYASYPVWLGGNRCRIRHTIVRDACVTNVHHRQSIEPDKRHELEASSRVVFDVVSEENHREGLSNVSGPHRPSLPHTIRKGTSLINMQHEALGWRVVAPHREVPKHLLLQRIVERAAHDGVRVHVEEFPRFADVFPASSNPTKLHPARPFLMVAEVDTGVAEFIQPRHHGPVHGSKRIGVLDGIIRILP